jgi:hypothetical protein
LRGRWRGPAEVVGHPDLCLSLHPARRGRSPKGCGGCLGGSLEARSGRPATRYTGARRYKTTAATARAMLHQYASTNLTTNSTAISCANGFMSADRSLGVRQLRSALIPSLRGSRNRPQGGHRIVYRAATGNSSNLRLGALPPEALQSLGPVTQPPVGDGAEFVSVPALAASIAARISKSSTAQYRSVVATEECPSSSAPRVGCGCRGRRGGGARRRSR